MATDSAHLAMSRSENPPMNMVLTNLVESVNVLWFAIEKSSRGWGDGWLVATVSLGDAEIGGSMDPIMGFANSLDSTCIVIASKVSGNRMGDTILCSRISSSYYDSNLTYLPGAESKSDVKASIIIQEPQKYPEPFLDSLCVYCTILIASSIQSSSWLSRGKGY